MSTFFILAHDLKKNHQNKTILYMRRIIFLLGLVTISIYSTCTYAAESNALDTIIKVEGKIMPVDVIKVTSSYVRFTVPGNSEVFTLPRKEVHKIIYKSGRIEEFNSFFILKYPFSNSSSSSNSRFKRILKIRWAFDLPMPLRSK